MGILFSLLLGLSEMVRCGTNWESGLGPKFVAVLESDWLLSKQAEH